MLTAQIFISNNGKYAYRLSNGQMGELQNINYDIFRIPVLNISQVTSQTSQVHVISHDSEGTIVRLYLNPIIQRIGGGGRGSDGASGYSGFSGQNGTNGTSGFSGFSGQSGSNINIYNSDGTLTSIRTLNMDGKNLIFTNNGIKSIDFLLKVGYFNDGINPDVIVFDWQNQTLYRRDGSGSVFWNDSVLSDTNNQTSVAWVDRILYSDNAGQIQSVAWQTRALTDSTAFDTLNWEDSQLFSTVNGLSADWELRRLYDSISGDSSLDWEAKELHSVWDARDGLKIGTGDTITKVIAATDTLDFPDTASQTSSDLTITLTGAADGDVVSLGVPNASVMPNSSYSA